MKKIRFNIKIIGGFLAGALVALLIGSFRIFKLRQIEAADLEMYEVCTQPLGDLGTGLKQFELSRNRLKDIVIAMCGLGKAPDEYLDAIKKLDAEFQDALNGYERTIRVAEVREKFEDARSALKRYYPVWDKFISLALNGKKEDALNFLYTDGSRSCHKGRSRATGSFPDQSRTGKAEC